MEDAEDIVIPYIDGSREAPHLHVCHHLGLVVVIVLFASFVVITLVKECAAVSHDKDELLQREDFAMGKGNHVLAITRWQQLLYDLAGLILEFTETCLDAALLILSESG